MVSYASYTYESRHRMVRYAHLQRLKNQAKLVHALNPKTWLDYGTGDGGLLLKMNENGLIPKHVTCYEPIERMADDLKKNLGSIVDKSNIEVVSDIDDLDNKKFELITSFGVLEHLPLPERIKFYRTLEQRLAPSGSCLIEVPIEYGPILLISECGRRFLKKRKSNYSFIELFKAAFLGQVEDTYDRFNLNDNRSFIAPHQGFSLCRFVHEIKTLGHVEEKIRSPFKLLPLWINQTVFYELKIAEGSEMI